MRIVSLLPSATDIVCSLGLRDHLVGRTHECDWPPGISDVPVMTRDVLDTASMSSREIDRAVGESVHGGSSIYALDHDALAAAKPDLIITQELCEVCAVAYEEVSTAVRMMEATTQVISLEPSTIEEIFATISAVASLTGAENRGKILVDESRHRLARVRRAVEGNERVPTVCIEWLDPIFDAGHWVPEQVGVAGGRELLGAAGETSRRREWADVVEAQPEALILLPCGLDMERGRREAASLASNAGWADLPAVREGWLWIVNGPAYFNRPGPRVVRGVEVLAHALHGIGSVGGAEAIRLG